MTTLWNMLSLRQKLGLQDAIRWGTLAGAAIAMWYGALHWDALTGALGAAWSIVFWYAQFRGDM